jgi:hypothetical protein
MKITVTTPPPAPGPPRVVTIEMSEEEAEGLFLDLEYVRHSHLDGALESDLESSSFQIFERLEKLVR